MSQYKSFILVFLILSPLFGFSQAPAPDNLNLEPLRTWLKQNWYDGGFNDLGYNGARTQMYGFVDENNGLITCVYTGFQQASGFVTFPDPMNAEHVVPQSLYGSASPMRSDIHNLRGTHGSANSARGNKPYDDATGNISYYGVDGNGNYFSTGTAPTNAAEFSKGDTDSWEPRESMKGNIARQVFYFFTMYPTQAGGITNVGDINTLYQWHLDDPVDAAEVLRNDRINSVQGNLNPYISYPELVFRAWLFAEVFGCTDETAFNYDPIATTDDGSCIPLVTGCTDELAINYSPLANTDDGSCLFEVLGCTYEAALNFDLNATLDDGSCLFPSQGVLGCTYINANNYDSSATEDDGSCNFDPGVLGCTYSQASNFNSNAVVDDGTCIFEMVNTCPEDIDNNGVVDTTDFLLLLGAFGSSCE